MFLYSFAKDGNTNYVLGTSHQVPFEEAFTGAVKEFLCARYELVTEHKGFVLDLIKQNLRTEPDHTVKRAKDIIMGSVIVSGTLNMPDANFDRLEAKVRRFLEDIEDESITLENLTLGSINIILSINNSDTIDTVLEKRYKDKTVGYLEEFKDIARFFAEMTGFAWLGFLCQSDNSCQRETEKYVQGNCLKEYLTLSREEGIYQRNAIWMPKIYNIHSGHSDVLFAVGAGHLFGETGILRELLKNGYILQKFDGFMRASDCNEYDLNKSEVLALYYSWKQDPTTLTQEEQQSILRFAEENKVDDSCCADIISELSQYQPAILGASVDSNVTSENTTSEVM